MTGISDVARVQVAWDSNPLSTSPAYHALPKIQQCTVRRGRSNGVWMPSTCNLQVWDRDGLLDGTRTNRHLSFTATAGQYASTASTSGLNFTTGYMVLRWHLLDWFPAQTYDWARLADKGWVSGTRNWFVGVRNGGSGSTPGAIELGISSDGTTPTAVARWDDAADVLAPGWWLEIESYITGSSRVTIFRASPDGTGWAEYHRDTYGAAVIPNGNTEILAVGATNIGGGPYKGRIGRFQAWEATVARADMDPNEYTSGTSWTSGGATWNLTHAALMSAWTPGRQRRLRVAASEDTFATSAILFDGFIDTIAASRTTKRNVVTIAAVDLIGWLAKFRLVDSAAAREHTGERISRILAAAGVPAAHIGTLDRGEVVMPAATISGNALQLCQEAARAEFGGHLFVKPSDGKIYYRGQWAQITGGETDWQTSALTLGTSGVTVLDQWDSGIVGPARRVVAERLNGDPLVNNFTAIDWFAETVEIPSVDCAYDSDIFSRLYVESYLRFDAHDTAAGFKVLAYPGHTAGLGAAVDELQPINRVSLVHTPKGGTSRTDDLVVEQVTHSIDGRRDRWEVTCDTRPYLLDELDPGDWFALGTSTLNSTKDLAY